MLVQMERQIDREIAADKKYAQFSQGTDFNDGDDTDLSDNEDLTEYAPLPQIVTNDLKSLDEMVSVKIEILYERNLDRYCLYIIIQNSLLLVSSYLMDTYFNYISIVYTLHLLYNI